MQVFTQFGPDLESLWNRALSKAETPWPFYAYAWHEAWFRLVARDESLVVCADPDRNIVLPLAVRQDHTAHFSGGEEIADYLDAIGPESAKSSAWQQALAALSEHGATSVQLRNIPEASASLTFFRSRGGATVEREDTTPIAGLPDSFDSFVRGLDRKNRHELRRKMRRFEESFPEPSLRVLEGPDITVGRFLQFMRENDIKNEFLTPEMDLFFREIPAILGEKLRQFCLVQESKSIAAILGFLCCDSLLLYNSGYRNEYPGSGFYLKTLTIKWAIEHHISSYNFLQGDERYKYELGGKDALVYRVLLPLT